MSTPAPGEDQTFSPIESVDPSDVPSGLPGEPQAPQTDSIPPYAQLSASPTWPAYGSTPHPESYPAPTEQRPQRSGLLVASLIINCITLSALLIGAFFVMRQNIVTAQNERASTQNAETARDLAAEVTRLDELNKSLNKSLAAARKGAGATATSPQQSTVISGVATDLSTCSSAIHEVSDRLVELIRDDPAGAGETIKTILERCDYVADRATTAAEALNG